MNLSTLQYAKGSRRRVKRLGRGNASGHGGESGKGHKGQKSRSGAGVKRGFEGGQMPLQRRIPKFGFTNLFRKAYQVVNLDNLAKLEGHSKVTRKILFENGLIKNQDARVKILGQGDISQALEVEVHAVSESAKTKIEKAGGKVVLIG